MPEEIGQPGNEEDLNKEVALEESLESELTEQDKTELDNILADLKNFDFEKLDGIKPKFHEKIALRLIEGGRGHYIPYYLNRFKGLDHRRIALKLVESGDVDDLAFYLRNFKGLDHREIALKILERGKANVNSFLRSLKNFQNIDFNEIALKLIEEGKVEAVAEHLNEFHNLSNEVALKLIEKGEGNKVGVYIDRFQGLNYQEIALALIAARKSIILADTIEKFHGLDRKEIALRIIQSGYGQYVIIERNIEKFHELDQEVALKLIEAGEGGKVVGCIEKFKDINYSEIALKLIERGCQQQLMNRSCWAKFKHLDRRVALSLMEHEGDSFVSFHLDDFHNLDQEIAIKLIEAGKNKGDGYNHVETVVRSLNKFEAIDFNEIALKLIDVGASKTVVENIDKFSGLGQEVALKLIEGGLGEWVIKNTDKFQGIVYQSVVIKLIESGQSNLIFQYEDKFKELYPEFVVLKEFQEAVKKRVIDVLIKSVKVDDAIVLAKRYSLPTEVIASVEIQQVASSKLGEMLRRGDIYFTKVLNEFFNLPPDIIKGIIENLPASQGYMACLLFDVDSGLKVKIWQELIQELEKDAFIAGKFQLANSLWGHKEWESIIKENLVFWQNPHDNLLFLEKIELLKEVRKDLFNPVLPPDFKLKDSEGSFFVAEEQRELFKLALQPIINRGFTEFSKLNELLGYFDLSKYREKMDGKPVPFASFEVFSREAEMQRYDIQIPTMASEEFKEAMTHLISVKGVDVPFLRRMINDYKKGIIESKGNDRLDGNYEEGEGYAGDEYEDFDNRSQRQENFPIRLINIIEGDEPINENKTIKPWSETFSLDPVHRLVFTAVGIHSLNNVTVKLQEYCNTGGALAGIIEVLGVANKEIIEGIEKEYEEKIKTEPTKKNKLKAESNRQIKKNQLLVYGGNQEFAGVSDFNESTWSMVLHAFSHKLIDKLSSALEERSLKELVYSALTDLVKKREIIDSCVDLIPFRNALLEGSGKLMAKFDKETIKEASPKEILDLFIGQEATLSAYLLYLGINNRRRQTESKKFKTIIDQTISQEKYKKELQQLKVKGILEQKADVFAAYTQGLITLDKNDDEAIREALKTFGYAGVGRNLKAEIASGDDYTAWTCGDQTNCCMPFTSEKNQEYLLRDDTAYFVIKMVNQAGNEEIIAQSVLVEAENPNDKNEQVVGIDNIEIANRAINLRPAIKEAYDKLRDELVSRYLGKPLRLIIGTSYNDDGGVVTGDLPLVPINSTPRQGNLSYSDCFSHFSAYEFYNSRGNKSLVKYFGLAKDLLERSKVYDLVKDKQEMDEIERLMGKIGQGEDDGDGGLNFPDNYSTVIIDVGTGNQVVGYVVAADYLTSDDEENDYVVLEKIGWKDSLGSEEAKGYLKDYLTSRDLIAGKSHDDLDGLKFKQEVIASHPEFMSWLEEFYGAKAIAKSSGGVVVNWA